MNELPSGHFFAILLTFLLAGIVKGVTGMGLPTIAMGVLGTLMPPVMAASVLIVPSFVTNVWQLAAGPSFTALIARLWTMMLAILVGTIAASSLLTSANTEWTTRALGCVLVLYAVVTLLARQLSVPPRMERWLSPVIGVVTGAITGATGVFVIPAVPYLQALGLGKDDLIQALGLSFTTSTIALAVGLGLGDAFDSARLVTSALAVIPALLGMWSGAWMRGRLSPVSFRRAFLLLLLLLGLDLAWSSRSHAADLAPLYSFDMVRTVSNGLSGGVLRGAPASISRSACSQSSIS